ncbi:MAG: hypothetical protein H6718_13795 [Polyangiaceae bacterium]|nr:hypothetical protein [Polyangiaceae bacterium]MCB9605977.1 hypothetical protein [Polyangiaceae bacterium]
MWRRNWIILAALVTHGVVWQTLSLWLPEVLKPFLGWWLLIEGPALLLSWGMSLLPIFVIAVSGVLLLLEAAIRQRHVLVRLVLAVPLVLWWLSWGLLSIAAGG